MTDLLNITNREEVDDDTDVISTFSAMSGKDLYEVRHGLLFRTNSSVVS